MKRLYDKALIDQIAKVYGNEVVFLSEFSKALLDIIREGLIRDGQVRLHRFGTFKLKWMKSRNGVNPSTGKKIIIQARPRVVFVPAKALKERIEPISPALQPLDENGELIETPVAVVETVVVEAEAEAQNDVVDEPVVKIEAETAVADIQDEIEVLEQVVEILKTETQEVSNNAHTAASNVKSVSGVSSEWLDKSVVENIKEISDLQYFKKTETSNTQTLVEPADDRTIQQEQVISDNDILDIDFNTFSQKDKQKSKNPAKAIFAVAAAIIVLVAAGVLINAINFNTKDKNSEIVANQNIDSQYVYSYAGTAENEKIVAPAVHVPIETANNSVTFDVVENTEFESTVDELPPVAVLGNKKDDIVVSTQRYDELQRTSSENDVFFSEVDHRLTNGDSLWRLAKKHYVNPFYWPHIYQANRLKVADPDKVKIGKVISLPTLYGRPDALTTQDKHNIAMGYYYNYLYHKGKGNPYAYFSLIGVEKYDAKILIEYKEEIEYSDVNNLALLTE